MKRPNRFLRTITTAWFIAFLALAARLEFAWDQQRRIPHTVLASVPFDQEAGNIALSLSEGHGYANLFRKDTGTTAWLAPVYPVLLFGIFRFFGAMTFASFFAAVLLNAVFSAVATLPLCAIARRVAGDGVAAAVGWAWAFLPAGVLMPFEWIWDTSLSVLLAVTLVWLTLLAAESPRALLWIAYGLLWGIALLANPALGIALPFLFAWAVLRAGFLPQRNWSVPFFAAVTILLCCLPWTLRNYRQFHRLIPVRSSLPFELWIGNNDIFDPHATGGMQRITRYEETRRYARLGETAYLDEKRHLAGSFIREKPALFARLAVRRVTATWFGTEHPLEDFKRTDSALVRSIFVVNALLTVGTLAGIALLLFARHPQAVPLVAFPVLYPVVYYLTHTSLRYRHPIDPLLVLLTVFSAAFALSRRRSPVPGRAFPFIKTI